MYEVTISPVLHVLSGDVLRFRGPADECPPIPRAGDEIVCQLPREAGRHSVPLSERAPGDFVVCL